MISRGMPLCGAGCVSACTGVERMDTPWLSSLRLFDAGDVAAYKLTESDLPVLQDLFVANPGYFLSVNGMPPRADEAKHEFEDGLSATVQEYLRIYGNIKKMLVVAPSELWSEAMNRETPLETYSQVSIHRLIQENTNFNGIDYLVAKSQIPCQ